MANLRLQVQDTMNKMANEESVFVRSSSYSRSELALIFNSLATSHALRTLTINELFMVKALAGALETNKGLIKLRLFAARTMAASQLAYGLQASTTLQTLEMSGCKFGGKRSEFEKLARAVNRLRELSLVACELDNGHCQILLQNGRVDALIKLRLSANRIRDAGAASIAQFLLENPKHSLQHVDLDENCIGASGIGALLKGSSGGSLKTISVSNQVTISLLSVPISLPAASNGVASHLTCLNLAQTNLTEEDATLIARKLVQNWPSLCELNLSRNPRIGDDGAAALARAMEKNSSLRVVQIRHCNIGQAGRRAFMKSLCLSKVEQLGIEDDDFPFLDSLAMHRFMQELQLVRRILALRVAADLPRLSTRCALRVLPKELVRMLHGFMSCCQ